MIVMIETKENIENNRHIKSNYFSLFFKKKQWKTMITWFADGYCVDGRGPKECVRSVRTGWPHIHAQWRQVASSMRTEQWGLFIFFFTYLIFVKSLLASAAPSVAETWNCKFYRTGLARDLNPISDHHRGHDQSLKSRETHARLRSPCGALRLWVTVTDRWRVSYEARPYRVVREPGVWMEAAIWGCAAGVVGRRGGAGLPAKFCD